MLNTNDIEKIEKTLNFIINYLEKKTFNIKINNLQEGERNDKLYLAAEDAGYIVGNLGGFSYIFSRAFIIDDKGNKDNISVFYLLPYAYIENKKILDLADIISRTIEYYLMLKFVKRRKPDIVLIDGSLISDLINASLFLSPFAKGRYFETFVDFLDKYSHLEPENIEQSNFHLLPEIYITLYIKFIRDLLEFSKQKDILLLYFIKRPIDSRKLVEKIAPDLSKMFNDYLFLNLSFRGKNFVTDLFKSELEGEAIRQLFIDVLEDYYFIYFRKVPNGHIYRIEIPGFYNKKEIVSAVFSILNNYSDIQGYPRLLLLVHKLCKIGTKEKKIIERLLISKLKDFVVPEATR